MQPVSTLSWHFITSMCILHYFWTQRCSTPPLGGHQTKHHQHPLSPASSFSALLQPAFAHLNNVDVVRVVLGWHEDQEQSLVELDAGEGCNPHVEEDAKEHSQRDLPQHVPHHNGQACRDRAQGMLFSCTQPSPTSSLSVLGCMSSEESGWRGCGEGLTVGSVTQGFQRGAGRRVSRGSPAASRQSASWSVGRDTARVRSECLALTPPSLLPPSRGSPTRAAISTPVTRCSFTSSILGFSPGAMALLMTVRALTWVTERTVAAVSQGSPKRAQSPPIVPMSSRSRWKPEPFSSFLSFLLTISLGGKRVCVSQANLHTSQEASSAHGQPRNWDNDYSLNRAHVGTTRRWPGDGRCQPQIRGFVLCLSEAGLHHTVSQEESHETVEEPKKMWSEMGRVLPLLSHRDVRHTSTPMAPAPTPALPAWR